MPADQYAVIRVYNGTWSGYTPPDGGRESMRASRRIFAGWPVGQKEVVFESLEDLWMPMHKGMVVAVMSEVVPYQQTKDFQAETLLEAGVTKRVEYVELIGECAECASEFEVKGRFVHGNRMTILNPDPAFGPSDYLQRSPEDAAPFELEESETVYYPSEDSGSEDEDAPSQGARRCSFIVDRVAYWVEQIGAWFGWLGVLLHSVGEN
ncbi:hypothetical protein H0H92_010653 [Tricholoma furcatifolium]|nr:hypothetical protein H0H92_013527 [Tricholoma furcatifolium]KAG6831440.1 hypothetical protein H0H92_010653 [Tricholoma furcatifolium]